VGGARCFIPSAPTSDTPENYAYVALSPAEAATLNGSMSVALWVRRNVRASYAGRAEMVFAIGPATDATWAISTVNAGATRNALLVVDYRASTHFVQTGWGGTATQNLNSCIIPADGAWHHLVLVRTVAATSTVEAYVDGVLVQSISGMTNPSSTAASFVFFGFAKSNTTRFGNLDAALNSVRLYSEALSASDVSALYQRESMASVQLSTLRTRVRSWVDMIGSTFVSDSEMNTAINSGLDELYDVIVSNFGDDYYVSSSALNTVAGTSAYALPSDFYKLLGVDLTMSSDAVALEAFNFKERNTYRAASGGTVTPRYRLEGNNLRLYPAPASVLSGTIWYVPQRTQLVLDGDTCNFPQGWEEYAVIDAALHATHKEESDLSGLLQKKAALRQRIVDAAANRNLDAPARVTDTGRAYIGDDDWTR
jgi:hypothetical protein